MISERECLLIIIFGLEIGFLTASLDFWRMDQCGCFNFIGTNYSWLEQKLEPLENHCYSRPNKK